MPRKRAERIADALEERVFTGAYTDGDRLDEVTLAQEFGVSRTPIREALARLVAADLAEQLPRRGVFIRQPGPTLLGEMFETMAEIEAACGRLAAKRITSDGLQEIVTANTACLAAVEADNADAYSRANETFHALIYSHSGNGFLAGEAQHLFRRLKPFRRVQLQLRGRMTQSIAEHEAVIDALQHHDSARTADALRNHVAPQGERFYPQVAQLSAAQ